MLKQPFLLFPRLTYNLIQITVCEVQKPGDNCTVPGIHCPGTGYNLYASYDEEGEERSKASESRGADAPGRGRCVGIFQAQHLRRAIAYEWLWHLLRTWKDEDQP